MTLKSLIKIEIKLLLFGFLTLIIFNSCYSQTSKTSNTQLVGGPCEGCEAIHEYGDKVLIAVDTLPTYYNSSAKLKISGIVYNQDGKTPAEDVILYIYHTNPQGIYPTKGVEKGWDRRHGYIRGWIKTGDDGKYNFYTVRPGAYPGGAVAEHIHITVKEQDINEYYIDDFLFDDDPLLTTSERSSQPKRGGSGIVSVNTENGHLSIKRDIILGLNIPNYQ